MRRLLPLLLLPSLALAHGENPRVTTITFPPQFPDSVWAVTDSQGLFARIKDGFVWLCEDSFAPGAGLKAVAPLGEDEDRWLVATARGLFLTRDRGCSSDRIDGVLADHVPTRISPHPVRRLEALVGTATPDRPNGLFLTEDGGESWVALDAPFDGRVRSLRRSESDPERVYVSHRDGLHRSDDAGRTWAPTTLGPEGLMVRGPEVHLLGVAPDDPDVLLTSVERLPNTIVLRSADGGETWTPVLEVDDLGLEVVFDAAGEQVLLASRFSGAFRSADGGLSWTPEETPVETLSCLTREPGTDRLWGCAHVFFEGPWALGSSEDFGRTWMPELSSFEDTESTWDCGPRSRARRCCAGLCPGQPLGAVCGEGGGGDPAEKPFCQRPPPGVEVDAGAPEADAGAFADAGVDDDATVAVDAAVVADAGAEVDAAVDAQPLPDAAAPRADAGEAASSDGGCRLKPGPALPGAPIALLLAALGFAASRRRRACAPPSIRAAEHSPRRRCAPPSIRAAEHSRR